MVPPVRVVVDDRRSTARPLTLAVLLVAAAAACGDDALGPDPDGAETMAPEADVAEYHPAILDASSRVLDQAPPTLEVRTLDRRLTELSARLAARDRRAALVALRAADVALSACTDACLAPPERGVVLITLERAAQLLGLPELSAVRM